MGTTGVAGLDPVTLAASSSDISIEPSAGRYSKTGGTSKLGAEGTVPPGARDDLSTRTNATTQTSRFETGRTLTLRSRQTLQDRDWRFGSFLRASGAERARGSASMVGASRGGGGRKHRGPTARRDFDEPDLHRGSPRSLLGASPAVHCSGPQNDRKLTCRVQSTGLEGV